MNIERTDIFLLLWSCFLRFPSAFLHIEVFCQSFAHILGLKEPHYWSVQRQVRWRRMTRFALIAKLSVVPGAIQAYNNLSRVSVSWKFLLFGIFWQADFLL